MAELNPRNVDFIYTLYIQYDTHTNLELQKCYLHSVKWAYAIYSSVSIRNFFTCLTGVLFTNFCALVQLHTLIMQFLRQIIVSQFTLLIIKEHCIVQHNMFKWATCIFLPPSSFLRTSYFIPYFPTRRNIYTTHGGLLSGQFLTFLYTFLKFVYKYCTFILYFIFICKMIKQ